MNTTALKRYRVRILRARVSHPWTKAAQLLLLALEPVVFLELLRAHRVTGRAFKAVVFIHYVRRDDVGWNVERDAMCERITKILDGFEPVATTIDIGRELLGE